MGQPQSNKKLDSLSLILDKSFIYLKLNLAFGAKEISAKLADHQNFHQIRLGYSKQFFWLYVDNHQKMEDHLSYNSLVNEDKLYVGGHQLIRKVDRLIDVDFFEGNFFFKKKKYFF